MPKVLNKILIIDFQRMAVPDTDYEASVLDNINEDGPGPERRWYQNLKYGLVGILFGIAFTKAEVISWFRIQEMFRLQSFHMYGVIGTAIVVGMISLWLIKRFKVKTVEGEQIEFYPKKFN